MPGHILFSGVPEQAPTGPPGARQNITATADMFGGATAAATQKLGAGLEHVAETGFDVMRAENTLQNEIHASQTNTWLADAITDRYEKFAALRGQAAVNELPTFKGDVERLYNEHMDQGGNLQTRALMAKAGRSLTTQYYRYGANHAAREERTWADQTAQRRAATFGAQAANAADNADSPGMETALNTSDDEVRKLAEQHGFDDEATNAMVLKNRGHNMKTIIETIGTANPIAAKDMYDRYKDGMDPESQLHVKNYLRSKLSGVIAKGKVDDILGPETGAAPGRKFEGVLIGRESGYNAANVNQFGYAGLHQFGAPRLQTMGVYTPGGQENMATWSSTSRAEPGKWTGSFSIPGFPQVKTLQDFLASPAAQRATYGLHQDRMDKEIDQNGFDKYIGQTIGGVPITREGLYAMMHIGGPGGTRRALESGGKDAAKDANGTSVMDYARLGAASSMSPYAALPDKSVAYERAYDAAGGNEQVLNGMLTEINRRYARANTLSADARTTFDSRVKDTTAEFMRTGAAANPIGETEFIGQLGLDEGKKQFAAYQANAQLGADVASVSTMTEPERATLLANYKPAPGEGYERAVTREKLLRDGIKKADDERKSDVGRFALARLPVAQEAYKNMVAALSDPGQALDLKQQAVASYAAKMDLEQARLGIAPDDRRLMPQQYFDDLDARLAEAATKGDDSVARQIAQVAALWGKDYWPQISAQLQAKSQPLIRVLASDVKPFAGRMLAELGPVDIKGILKDQHDVKATPLHNDVIDAMKPFGASITGQTGGVPLFNDFASQVEKLAAFYVLQGKTTTEAAKTSFDDIIGFKYEWGPSYRIPKGAGMPNRETIADGLGRAREKLKDWNLAVPRDDIGGLNPAYRKTATAELYRRDGVWVTAPDESGLALTYNNEAVKQADGKPLILGWQDLARLAGEGPRYPSIAGERAGGGPSMQDMWGPAR